MLKLLKTSSTISDFEFNKIIEKNIREGFLPYSDIFEKNNCYYQTFYKEEKKEEIKKEPKEKQYIVKKIIL